MTVVCLCLQSSLHAVSPTWNSISFLALYLHLHHSSETKRNPTTIFRTIVNLDVAILIILRAFIISIKYFMTINNIVFTVTISLIFCSLYFRPLRGKQTFHNIFCSLIPSISSSIKHKVDTHGLNTYDDWIIKSSEIYEVFFSYSLTT